MNPAAASHPASTFVVSKWSARPTSRDKLARARINQRRHRERVKDHIVELERSLADTEAELRTARATIQQLEAALREARTVTPTVVGEAEETPRQQDAIPPPTTTAPEPAASPLLCQDANLGNDCSFEALMCSEEQRCRQLAPPGSHESTTRCRDACAIVTAQNFAGLDVASLCDWLRPGFRGALDDGGGCRVENTLLLGLIDYIS